MLEGEQQQQGDQQRKDAERLGNREAENQVTELALRGGRIAQCGGEIMAEDGADPYAGTAHADAGDAGADHFCGLRSHDESSFSRVYQRASVARVDRLTGRAGSEESAEVGPPE